jgi:glucosamine 6-phosphate synthetase-like amidotransferase/phosphosugar isomerase protein
MTQKTEFSENDFLAELKSVVDEIGGKLSIALNNVDMSYVVTYYRNGIPFKISLEALEAACSTNGPGTLRQTLLEATTHVTMLNDKQNELICELMNVSDTISNHAETTQERAEKLKAIVRKIMPEKMESYFHTSEDLSMDPFGRFEKDDVFNILLRAMKYDLIQHIANI